MTENVLKGRKTEIKPNLPRLAPQHIAPNKNIGRAPVSQETLAKIVVCKIY